MEYSVRPHVGCLRSSALRLRTGSPRILIAAIVCWGAIAAGGLARAQGGDHAGGLTPFRGTRGGEPFNQISILNSRDAPLAITGADGERDPRGFRLTYAVRNTDAAPVNGFTVVALVFGIDGGDKGSHLKTEPISLGPDRRKGLKWTIERARLEPGDEIVVALLAAGGAIETWKTTMEELAGASRQYLKERREKDKVP